jgi:hypothetical protein
MTTIFSPDNDLLARQRFSRQTTIFSADDDFLARQRFFRQAALFDREAGQR